MFIVSVTGPGHETRAATNELVREFPDALKTNIQPSCLARECTNQMPAWRFELHRAMSTGKMIVNDMSHTNCDEVIDFVRSVRALSSTYQPFVFSTGPPSECVTAHYALETVKDLLFMFKK